MTLSVRHIGSLLLTSAVLWAAVAFGTVRGEAPVAETWTVFAGDIIEILPLHDIPDAKYGWVLIKDAGTESPEEFLEGSTAKIFRYRPIQPGSYTLFGDIASGDGRRHLQRGFRFVVNARTQDQPALPEGTNLVATEPTMRADGSVILRSQQQLLRLIPLNAQRTNMGLDTDISVDADGNGNPTDDIENTDTFFQSTATPMYLWFASPPLRDRSLGLSAGQGGETQRAQALSFEFARENSLLTSNVAITAEMGTGGTVRFIARLEESFPIGDIPLLYRWSFGDGEESLETEATHTYANPGEYTVSVQVTTLSTGGSIGSATAPITIVAPQVASSAATSSGESASSVAAAPTEQGDGFLSGTLGTVLLGGGVLLVSILIGAGVIFLLSRLRKGSSLDEHLARMEKNIVQKEKGKILDATAPVAITATPVPATAKPAAPKSVDEAASPTQLNTAEAEVVTTPPTPSSPNIDPQKAPAWLKKGLSGETVSATVTTSAPAKAPEKKPEPPAPKPVQATPPTPAPTDAALPNWLSSPPAPSTPAPAPTAAPASATDERLPDWLKPVPTPAPSAPAPKPPVPQTAKPPEAVKPPEVKPQQPAPQAPPKPEAPKPPVAQAKAPVPAAPQPVKPPEAPKAPAPQKPEPPKIADSKPQPAPQNPPRPPAPAKPVPPPAPQPAAVVPAPSVQPKPITPAKATEQNPAPVAPPAVAPTLPASAPVAPPVQAAAPTVEQAPTPQPSAPAPSNPSPAPAAPVTPPPQAPVVSQTPKPAVNPAAPVQATPPVPTNAPRTPAAPVPPEAPKPVPSPEVTAQTPKAVQPQEISMTPAQPPKPATPEPQDILPADEPIAFIRAESLNPQDPPKPQA